jgi:cytoskeletal protein RodZ
MALSADEQRELAEIERRLATDDPGLATCLTAFHRPGPSRILRSPRARIIGSLFTVLLVAMVSLMVYAMIPFRAAHNNDRQSSQTTPGSVSTASTATGTGTGTGGQQQNSPLASASTGASASATDATSSAPPSAAAGTGTGPAKPAGTQAADQVASSPAGP